ncbi:MAG TPA: tetratricopeptide repeat protein [Blastocatellia bacterium]|nr:tetratricopeptide repeat protein [Blastocatellia bacterium]
MSDRLIEEWLAGRVSLGAAAQWTPEELRIVADLAWGLAEQGRNEEALTIFEGLAALAPSTAYFQSALGALKMRTGDIDGALSHLDAALASDPADIAALVNRGEIYARVGDRAAAIQNLEAAINLSSSADPPGPVTTRAKALIRRFTEGNVDPVTKPR